MSTAAVVRESQVPGTPSAPAAHLAPAAIHEYEERLQRLGRPEAPAAWSIWFDTALALLRLKYYAASPETDHALYNELSASATIGEMLKHLAEGTEFAEEKRGLNQVLAWAREL